jgi:hypothetical protein
MEYFFPKIMDGVFDMKKPSTFPYLLSRLVDIAFTDERKKLSKLIFGG